VIAVQRLWFVTIAAIGFYRKDRWILGDDAKIGEVDLR